MEAWPIGPETGQVNMVVCIAKPACWHAYDGTAEMPFFHKLDCHITWWSFNEDNLITDPGLKAKLQPEHYNLTILACSSSLFPCY